MKKLWFKRKTYGWGWTPVTWQGWLTIIIFVSLVVMNFRRIDSVSYSASDTLANFIPQTALLIVFLFLICYRKGESPKWQWGEKKEDNKL
ncbi:MAG: hypothetical protein AAB740_00275 [Patescibacteria group bacterium]